MYYCCLMFEYIGPVGSGLDREQPQDRHGIRRQAYQDLRRRDGESTIRPPAIILPDCRWSLQRNGFCRHKGMCSDEDLTNVRVRATCHTLGLQASIPTSLFQRLTSTLVLIKNWPCNSSVATLIYICNLHASRESHDRRSIYVEKSFGVVCKIVF